jgi:hypothetical protein
VCSTSLLSLIPAEINKVHDTLHPIKIIFKVQKLEVFYCFLEGSRAKEESRSAVAHKESLLLTFLHLSALKYFSSLDFKLSQLVVKI